MWHEDDRELSIRCFMTGAHVIHLERRIMAPLSLPTPRSEVRIMARANDMGGGVRVSAES